VSSHSQSLEGAEDIETRESIEKEKKSFIKMVEETEEEYFSLTM